MINEDPNMGRKQIFTELPLPSKVEEKGILTLIYKGVFIAVKLLLDIRLNLVKISEGKTIKTKFKQGQKLGRGEKSDTPKPDNPIKGLDNIKVEDKKPDQIKLGEDTKLKEIELTEGKTKTNTKDSKDSTPPTKAPDRETEKSDEATNDTNKPSEIEEK